jgi:lipoprotein-anchoring transpeptidase ErfK/SrfK
MKMVGGSGLKRAIMNNRLLTVLATVSAIVAGTSVAIAQGYPAPAGSYAPPPAPGDYRRAPQLPDFDEVDDEDGGPGRNAGSLPPPGPALSADDPRYGRSLAPPPVYSDRAPLPQGPVMSPDDPRYGRPMGAPPVYSNTAPAPQGPVLSPDDPRYGRPMAPPAYSNAAPQGPVVSPEDPRYGRQAAPPEVIYSDRDRGDGMIRPPEAIGGSVPAPGAPQGTTAAVPPGPVGADGRPPVAVSLLPPDEQPEANQSVQLPPNLRRQEMAFPTKEPAGTIVVDTSNTHLYYILGGGRAIRYGVRVGRDGFTWNGMQKISRKAEWPDWHPPTEMIERQPYLPRFMAGGPGNPLGARAMYLGSTVYRIHGTNQPSTIGKFVSSGCIGMLNEDVSDLFDRVKVGTRVVVLPGGPPPGATANAAPPPASPLAPAAGAVPPSQVPTAQAAPLPGTQPTAVPPLPAPVTIR